MDRIIGAKIKKVLEESNTKGIEQKINFIGKFSQTAFYGDIYVANVIYTGKGLPSKGLSIDYIVKNSSKGLLVCVEKTQLSNLGHIKALKGEENDPFKKLPNGLILDKSLTRKIQHITSKDLGLDR